MSLATVAACGGGGDTGGAGGASQGADGDGPPQAGGRLVYGLEAETTDGWCLPEAQLAASGITVARAVYDTLTRPNAEGGYDPWLARSVEHDEAYTGWTITLREGVTFHDGSELTAEVVKNNLDAYRGEYPARRPLLFTFVYDNIAAVEVVDPLTVSVTLRRPWVDFDAYLFFSGRLGIMAQAQLDDPGGCAENLVGTGPFALREWTPSERLVVERNPDYWATDAEGNRLPYLDEIEFRPIVEEAQRLNALEAGEIDVLHSAITETQHELHGVAETGAVEVAEPAELGEVTYVLFNVSQPPFDNALAREAVASAYDFEEFNAIRGHDRLRRATGPFVPGSLGHLEDSGLPDFDLERARELVRRYEEETGEPLRFTYTTTQAASTVANAELLREQWEAAGIEVEVEAVDQPTQIDSAISGDFEAIEWRNHPGDDPDVHYVWWRSGYPTNLGRLDDAEVDRMLDEGRSTPDPEARRGIYEDLNRHFAEQVYDLWLFYTPWSVATRPEVNGLLAPTAAGEDPFPGLAVGHPLETLWVAR